MSETTLVGLGGLVTLLVLLALRIPVALAMMVVGIVGNLVLSLFVPYLHFLPFIRQFKTLLFSLVGNYDLSVVPLFILMGYLAMHARLSHDLFHGIHALLGRLRGGVAMAAIGACAGFGAVCGSSLATAATMGRVALPQLDRMNYAPRFSAATLAAGGTLGILIPPSVVLVIYAMMVEASIIRMFQAAVVPSLLAVWFFLLVIAIWVRCKPALAPPPQALPQAEKRQALRRLWPVLLIFSTVILGLGLGLFTPTPAAAFGVLAVLGYGFWLRRDGAGLRWSGVRQALLETANTSGMIYLILFGAEVLKTFFTRSGLPAALAAWSTSVNLDPWLVLCAILLVLIVLGSVMESLSMVLVVIPFLWPVLIALNGGDGVVAENAAYGMDNDDLQIWFGILALVVVELGLITPPVGLNIFIIHKLTSQASMRDIFLNILPFFIAELLRVALLIFIPALSLALPHGLMR